jgi:hypothetical protein
MPFFSQPGPGKPPAPLQLIGPAGTAANSYLNDLKFAAKTPKSRILSANTTISLIVPHFGAVFSPGPAGINSLNDLVNAVASTLSDIVIGPGESPNEIIIGDIDNFTATKVWEVIKDFKPYGSKYQKKIVEDRGWDISFDSSKIDASMSYLVYLYDSIMFGENFDQKNDPLSSDLRNLYNRPLFMIRQTINHYDGTQEIYEFNQVNLLGFEQSISENNSAIKESMTAFAPIRVAIAPNDITKLNGRISNIIRSMNDYNIS